jgi:hypothetical protein
MNQEMNRPVGDAPAKQRLYDYCEGIMRSVRDRGGAASLGEIKGDVTDEAGAGVSLQILENARQVLVDDGTLYTELRWTRGLRGIRKRAVFLVLNGRPRGPLPVAP